MKNILIYIFLTLYVNIFCQSKMIIGNIFFSKDSKTELGDIYVINDNTKKIVLTNTLGGFKIDAAVGDLIKIEHYSIKNKSFRIEKPEFDQGKISVFIEPYYLTLQEVIFKKKLSGIFQVDAKLYNKTPKLELENIIGVPNYKGKNRQISEPILNPSIIPNPNINAIYDILSGERKKRENLYKFMDKDELVNKIRDYLGNKFFENELEIPSEHINHYIEYVNAISPLNNEVKNNNYVIIITELEKHRFIYLTRLKKSTYWNNYKKDSINK